MPAVTVVMPLFNSGTHLKEAVQSVTALKLNASYDIIIVNDGSTDPATHSVLTEIERSGQARIIHFERNQGVQAARNAGLEAATGEFIVTLDPDDLFLRAADEQPEINYLDEAIAQLTVRPEMAFVHTKSLMFGDFDGLTISSFPRTEAMIVTKHHVPTSIIFRREEITLGLRYDPIIRKWQDWSFGIRLLALRHARGLRNEIGFYNAAAHGYRVHSATSRISQKVVNEYEMTLLTVTANLPYFKAHYPDAPSAQEISRRVMAAKPSRFVDLLYMANFDLQQALTVMRQRGFELTNPLEHLGIP